MNPFLRSSLATLFLFLLSNSFAQKAVPELWGQRVHDEIHILKQSTVDQLEQKLKVYEDSTSNQVAILIVQSLDGDVIESYSIRVVEKWKLGQKGKDNGVLLLIAMDDHKMRIEVGQGLEGVLTDAKCSRIIRNEIAPEFRRGNPDGGVIVGIDEIISAIGGEYKASAMSMEGPLGLIIIIVAICFFLSVLIAAFVKEFRSKDKGPFPLKQKTPVKGAKKGGAKPMFIPNIVSSKSSGSFLSGGGSSSSFSGGGGNFGGGGSTGSW